MPRSILVPVDGSRFAEHALPHALARRSGARVHLALVHVPLEVTSASPPLAEEVAATEAWQLEEESVYMERLLERLFADGIEPAYALLRGHVPAAIGRYVEDHEIELVVMTTHGRGGLQRAWLGSTADSLLRRLLIPLLLVRPSQETGEVAVAEPRFSRVISALDGSRTAERALQDAVELGAAADAAITLAHILQPAVAAWSPYLPHPVQVTEDSLRQGTMQRYLDAVAASPWLEGRSVGTVLRVDHNPAHALLDLAGELEADLIVMGTHGRGGLRRMILGSVADKVIRGTSRSVLVHRGVAADERFTPAMTASARPREAAESRGT